MMNLDLNRSSDDRVQRIISAERMRRPGYRYHGPGDHGYGFGAMTPEPARGYNRPYYYDPKYHPYHPKRIISSSGISIGGSW
ncbi:hypothetical protein B488_05580 [Liberibacter crescens BT-1]|uniref:Uncharacterized protein n=2 Tax=Liberibacter crescens TaxID=1273132 RepID=L0EUP3_LIBCB|nr:hypothetical protein B488_05580 [Liberibacter crescens BT-1]